MSLEVAEIAADGLLGVDARGMVGKDEGNPIAVVGGKKVAQSRSDRDGSDPVEGPVDNSARVSSAGEERGHFGCSLAKVGLTGIDAMEMEKLEEWNGVFTGSRVQGCTVQTVVEI
eukprot:g36764.t1